MIQYFPLTTNQQWCRCPLYKTNCRPHTSIPPTHELSQSHFSRFTLTSQDIHSLSTWFGHGSCIFQWYWYVFFSNILSIFIWSIFIFMFLCILHLYIFLFLAFDLYLIMLPHFTWKNFLCIYFMFIFFCILSIRWYEQRTSPTTRTRFPP